MVFSNRKGSFRCEVDNDNFKLPKKATTEENLAMNLEIEGDDYIWYSQVVKLKLYEGIDASGKNKLEDLIEEEVAASTQNITNKLYNFYNKYIKKEVIENE